MRVHVQQLGAETRTIRRDLAATSYDCVRLIFVRDGSAVTSGDCASQPVAVGKTLLIAPNAHLGFEPEGNTTFTTLFVDADYLIEHFFWQHLDLIPDRDAARDLAAKLYPVPVQMLRLGEREIERLGPILDELVTLTETGQSTAGYFHTHALLFNVLEAISPLVHSAPVEMPPLTLHQRMKQVASPR